MCTRFRVDGILGSLTSGRISGSKVDVVCALFFSEFFLCEVLRGKNQQNKPEKFADKQFLAK